MGIVANSLRKFSVMIVKGLASAVRFPLPLMLRVISCVELNSCRFLGQLRNRTKSIWPVQSVFWLV